LFKLYVFLLNINRYLKYLPCKRQ